MGMARSVKIGKAVFGGRGAPGLIAGPCVIENRQGCIRIASRLARWALANDVPFVFKASYDKANRSSVDSFRGPGMSKGLEILREIKEKFGVPVLTDVHSQADIPLVAEIADAIQIPAFLCRQTDLVFSAGQSGKPVNVKKGQFLSAHDMANVVNKLEHARNRRILITERGNCFGYNDLVVDMRNISRLSEMGYPVIIDATHGVQKPGGAGSRSSGEAALAPLIARAGVAAGCDGVFLECHTDPSRSMSDRDTVLPVNKVIRLYEVLRKIHEVV